MAAITASWRLRKRSPASQPSWRARHQLRRPRSGATAALALLVWFSMLAFARADCECGYAAAVGGSQSVFTEVMETDFSRISDLSANTDWAKQAYNLSSQRARGQYGEMFSGANVVANPGQDASNRAGLGVNGRAAGLELVARSTVVDDMVPGAEVASTRMDILWGSLRIGMKLTDSPGTCAAFFWYFNDTQEIDMEFLSREWNSANGSFPVNLVLQSREAAEAGYNAQATGNFKKVYLPFDPSQDFHEYRIDFLPSRVLFYADGQVLATMNGSAVPSHAGHLIMQHWSNGNPLWSGGPPAQDAYVSVSYVKAYFNSSAASRQSDFSSRCKDPGAPGAVCSIPSAVNTRDPSFFSAQPNMTNNQSISSAGQPQKDAGGGEAHPRQWLLLALPLLAAGSASGLW